MCFQKSKQRILFIHKFICFCEWGNPEQGSQYKKGQTIWSSNDRADVFSTLISKGQAKIEKLKKGGGTLFKFFSKGPKQEPKPTPREKCECSPTVSSDADIKVQQTTVLEALVDETKRQIHIKSGQVRVITNMCEKLKILS